MYVTQLLYLEDNCLPLNFPSGSLLSVQELAKIKVKIRCNSFSNIKYMMKVADLCNCIQYDEYCTKYFEYYVFYRILT